MDDALGKNTPDQIRTGVAGSKVTHFSLNSQLSQRTEDIFNANRYDVSQNCEEVLFSKTDLQTFVAIKTKRLSKSSVQWIKKVAGYIWSHLNGTINIASMNRLSDFYLTNYPNTNSTSSIHKCFMYTRAFLTYLYKLRMDAKILSYHAIFERPKNKQPVKLLTSRIIVAEDVQKTLNEIIHDSTISEEKKLNYQSLILFLSYSGQRTITASRLTVNQFKEALQQNPQVLTVEAEQDKIRLQHYVPLHPVLISYLQNLIEGKKETDMLFDYLGLQRWLKYHAISLKRTKGKLELKDLRKFFEQKSDEIGFTDANKNFIMSHGVSSINWTSYKQFLPENVYKKYMDCWKSVVFSDDPQYTCG